MIDHSKHKFVFVGGLHRSGTSLLAKTLCALPGVSGFSNTGVPEDEGQHLQSVFLPAKAFGGPGKFCFDNESRLDEYSELLTFENKQRLVSEWSVYWDLKQKILVEKSPPNLVRSRFLQAVFDRSYFIFVVRHPIAVSLATRKWSKTDVGTLLRHWVCCHQTMLADLPYLKRIMLLRYEDFVEQPTQMMSKICRFLEIEDNASTLNFSQVDKRVNAEYFERWKSELDTLPVESSTGAQQVETIDLWSGFGYCLTPPRIIEQAPYCG